VGEFQRLFGETKVPVIQGVLGRKYRITLFSECLIVIIVSYCHGHAVTKQEP